MCRDSLLESRIEKSSTEQNRAEAKQRKAEQRWEREQRSERRCVCATGGKKEKEAQANLPVSTTDTKTLSRLQLSGTGVQHDWTGMIILPV